MSTCPISGLPIIGRNQMLHPLNEAHLVEFDRKQIPFNFSTECFYEVQRDETLKREVGGAILHYGLPDNLLLVTRETQMNIEQLGYRFSMVNYKEWLSEKYIPRTPDQLFDFVIAFLYKPGIDLSETFVFDKEEQFYKFFFCRSDKEFEFILKSLHSKGLIVLTHESLSRKNSTGGTKGYQSPKVELTYDGFLNSHERTRLVHKDLCFVAMSFGPDENPIFTEALKPAIEAAGYQARRVDDTDHHIDKEQTINDAILALAKKANFVVCDYTGNKRGVYFEHGYAWGLGKKVIMTVKESEMQDLHFDVSHYPFIVWEDLDDLRTRLQAKIESWIGRYEP